ncbi:YIP1 family protein [Bacillus sp. FSL W7-1360]
MNTWLNVWVRPRQVMKQELGKEPIEKDDGIFFGFALLCAFLMFIIQYEREYVATFQEIFLTGVIISVIMAVLSLYVFPWLYKTVGSWFGGKGSISDLRVAMLNGIFKPQIIVNALCIPYILITGESFFLKGEAFDVAVQYYTPLQIVSSLFFGLIMVTGTVWGLVVQLHAVGEAHQFSAWKALLVTVIIMLAMAYVGMSLVRNLAELV